MCIYIYMYIDRERERGRERQVEIEVEIERERERERERDTERVRESVCAMANCPNNKKGQAMHADDTSEGDKQQSHFVCYLDGEAGCESALTTFSSSTEDPCTQGPQLKCCVSFGC